MNSCIGCGEKRHLPEKIRKDLVKILDDHSDNSPKDKAFELVGEQLDTPAFANEHVENLVREIKKIEESSVPLILAHHNVLSQVTPRVEIYTELINGGLFRSRLASCSRPVIYCHGHIHKNSIEELTDHEYPSSKIIFVSAPLLYEGFNILEIVFSRNELPIGCIIHKFRVKPGGVDNTSSIEIPLVNLRSLHKIADKKLKALIRVCETNFRRFEDIRQLVKKEIGKRIYRTTLQDVIIEAKWLGLVEVREQSSKLKFWRIRRYE